MNDDTTTTPLNPIHDDARRALQRLIDFYFDRKVDTGFRAGSPEHPRITVPAQDSNDDLLLSKYLDNAREWERRSRELDAAKHEVAELVSSKSALISVIDTMLGGVVSSGDLRVPTEKLVADALVRVVEEKTKLAAMVIRTKREVRALKRDLAVQRIKFASMHRRAQKAESAVASCTRAVFVQERRVSYWATKAAEARAEVERLERGVGPAITRADARELLEMSEMTTSQECYDRVRAALREYAGGDFECHIPNPLDIALAKLAKYEEPVSKPIAFVFEASKIDQVEPGRFRVEGAGPARLVAVGGDAPAPFVSPGPRPKAVALSRPSERIEHVEEMYAWMRSAFVALGASPDHVKRWHFRGDIALNAKTIAVCREGEIERGKPCVFVPIAHVAERVIETTLKERLSRFVGEPLTEQTKRAMLVEIETFLAPARDLVEELIGEPVPMARWTVREDGSDIHFHFSVDASKDVEPPTPKDATPAKLRALSVSERGALALRVGRVLVGLMERVGVGELEEAMCFLDPNGGRLLDEDGTRAYGYEVPAALDEIATMTREVLDA